jgi:thioredoxin reductase (NADPH)
VIVGAGPAGLFQVFELGLLEIKAHVIDSLPYPGGQCIELYPDKPIYDIPALPVCTGRELVGSLLKQIEPFVEPGGANFHLGQEVSELQQLPDGRFALATNKGQRFVSKTIFIAAGVGAFQPRPLRIDGLDRYRDRQLFYRVKNPADFAGKRLVIVGGDDVALDWALHFANDSPHRASSVTLVHRRENLQAAAPSLAEMKALCQSGQLEFVVGQVSACEEKNGEMSALQVTGPDGSTRRLPADRLLVFLGLSPKLGPIAHWGLDMERKQLRVDTEKFSTNVPGIFAVGDINTYPGKKKLILCGFHECTLAAFGAAPFIFPDKTVQLQYTTTSSRLHKALGVEAPGADKPDSAGLGKQE